MQDEISQAIGLIDQKIGSLKKLRDQLASEFGQVQIHAPGKSEIASQSNGSGHLSRKDQVEKFIKEHGPSTRSEIIEGTGVPVGTIAYALNDDKRFVSRRGKWQVREEEVLPESRNP